MISIYSSTLTRNNTFFTRDRGLSGLLYYYEAIRISFHRSGMYRLSTNSTFISFGYIYNNTFDPFSPRSNVLTWNYTTQNNQQFNLFMNFTETNSYILIVTTLYVNVVGSFSVIARGLGEVSFSPLIQSGMLKTNTRMNIDESWHIRENIRQHTKDRNTNIRQW